MNLPAPTPKYDQNNEGQTRRALNEADQKNIKRGVPLDKLLLRDTDTGEIVTITVASGILVIA